MQGQNLNQDNANTNLWRSFFLENKSEKQQKHERTRVNITNVFLIPDTDNLTKTGIILYLIGIFCTFLYFSQFNILSVDFLKPQAIIVSIYVWLCGIVVPRTILLLTYQIKQYYEKNLWDKLLFITIIIASNFLILKFLSENILSSILLSIVLSFVHFLYHFRFRGGGLSLQPSHYRSYLFIPLYCIICSYFILPKIPYSLGGFSPVKVNVTTDNAELLKSRFSKSIYLLYESSNEYYFFEKRADADTKLVYNYVIKRVPKSEVKKIEIQKEIWQPF